LATFTDAVANLRVAGNLSDELGATVVLADMWQTAGQPGTARRIYTRALQRAEAHSAGGPGEPGQSLPRGTTDLHVGLGELDHEAGDIEGAWRHLETATGLDDRAGITENRHRWSVVMARVTSASGDPIAAMRHLHHAEQAYRPGFYPNVWPVAALRARLWIAQGQLSEAVAWAQERGLSTTDEVSYLREFEHLTLVRLRLAQHRENGKELHSAPGRHPAAPAPDGLEDVVALLDRLLAAAQALGRYGSALEIRMLQALTQDALGGRPLARELLSQALLEVPEPDGYARLFLDEGPAMWALLAEAAGTGPDGTQERRLLGLAPTPGAKPPTGPLGADSGHAGKRPTPSSTGPLTERELAVVRLLDSELSGPDIASELFISLNTLRSHTKNIFAKLGATSRREAVGRARERGLI
jgi:LuxR family maltose regulon positive regulatory protein